MGSYSNCNEIIVVKHQQTLFVLVCSIGVCRRVRITQNLNIVLPRWNLGSSGPWRTQIQNMFVYQFGSITWLLIHKIHLKILILYEPKGTSY